MSQLSVPISTQAFLRLAAFVHDNGVERDPVELVEDAVEYWISNAGWKQEDLAPKPNYVGYVWQIQRDKSIPACSLHLPLGTILRIKTAKGSAYAQVAGDRLFFEGKVVTPNQFALAATGSPRDAWRDVWVKRPSDTDFVRAETLRQAVRSLECKGAQPKV